MDNDLPQFFEKIADNLKQILGEENFTKQAEAFIPYVKDLIEQAEAGDEQARYFLSLVLSTIL